MYVLKFDGQVVGQSDGLPYAWNDAELVWEVNESRVFDPTRRVTQSWEGAEPAPYPFTASSAAVATIPLIGPIAFQMLFKVDELVAIDAAKDTNVAIRIFWKLLDDPRTDFVDRNLEPVQTMLRNLEADGLIGPGRAEEILRGSVSK